MKYMVVILGAWLAIGLSGAILSGCTGSANGDGGGSLPDSGAADVVQDDRDVQNGPHDSRSPDVEPDTQADSATHDARTEDGVSDTPSDADASEDAAPSQDTGPSEPDVPDEPTPIENPTHSSQVYLADPDTVLARDGTYITYGTTIGGGSGPRCGASGRLFVPYLEHGSGNSVRMSDCAAGDAMPGGPGSWAKSGGAIWAPGIARFGDTYYMIYTATKRGTGQKCLGRATSHNARGPFVSKGEWACPPEGRWAIDANPFVAGGKLYVAYRDDYINSFPETGLSVVRTDSQGRAIWDTRRDLLMSSDISWETTRMSGSSRVIENPTMFQSGGTWYVAYSGNNWASPRYSVGIARCGSSPLPTGRCSPVRSGVQKPYFGFTGSGGLDPYRGLPGNHHGPGGMDIFKAADGSLRAVWHWWTPSNGSRHSAVGRFLVNDGGFYVGE